MLQGNVQQVQAEILNRNGSVVNFQTHDGGAINLSGTFTDPQGFFIMLSPSATEGLLYVQPMQSETYKLLPFFKGRNPMLIKSITYSVSATATEAYWEK